MRRFTLHAKGATTLLNMLVVLMLVWYQGLGQGNAIAAEAINVAILYEGEAPGAGNAYVQSALEGANRASQEFSVPFTEYKMEPGANREEWIKGVITQHFDLVILVGFQYVAPVLKIADQFPNTRFTVIDGIVPPLFTNVQSIIFKDNEGAFLVGVIAALISKTDVVGFVGGMDVPLIRNFAYGFTQGVQYVSSDVKILHAMIGATPDAWSSPDKATSLADDQFKKGADVVFAAAGGSSIGVLEAAKKNGKFGIGVDANQNNLYPGNVLTSLVKRVDVVVYDAISQAREGKWQPGIKYLGIKEGALDYALDQNNKELVNKDIIDKVEAAKDKIIRGSLVVDVYSPY